MRPYELRAIEAARAARRAGHRHHDELCLAFGRQPGETLYDAARCLARVVAFLGPGERFALFDAALAIVVTTAGPWESQENACAILREGGADTALVPAVNAYLLLKTTRGREVPSPPAPWDCPACSARQPGLRTFCQGCGALRAAAR